MCYESCEVGLLESGRADFRFVASADGSLAVLALGGWPNSGRDVSADVRAWRCGGLEPHVRQFSSAFELVAGLSPLIHGLRP